MDILEINVKAKPVKPPVNETPLVEGIALELGKKYVTRGGLVLVAKDFYPGNSKYTRCYKEDDGFFGNYHINGGLYAGYEHEKNYPRHIFREAQSPEIEAWMAGKTIQWQQGSNWKTVSPWSDVQEMYGTKCTPEWATKFLAGYTLRIKP